MSTSVAPTIALVDDDSIFQLTASRMIHAANEEVTILQFSNGDEALQYLLANANNTVRLPDILLLDINMPVVDGWMFLNDYSGLKSKLEKAINIYMVSSSIDPQDIHRAKSNSHVTDYLIKPILREGFHDLLKSIQPH
jgi:two-component system, chemotaxis family, chemotaxis protein CheY